MATPAISPSFYADFSGLDALKASAKNNDPAALREAARQFESLFTQMVLKSMRDAKLGSDLGESQESDFYQDMFDQQMSVQMSRGKGLGLADMLVQQLVRSQGSSAGAASSTSSSTSGASASTAQQVSFVQALQPLAETAGQQLGVAPDTLIAQAALETGWGQHMPASSGNLFGIKAGGDWQGASVSAATTEFNQGAPSASAAAFRAYGSAAASVQDYSSLLSGSARYAGALGTGGDVQAFAGALQRGGYATDPNYAEKLAATAQTLQQLRSSGALKNSSSAPLTASTDRA
jgi:flagellar protein FlgJ